MARPLKKSSVAVRKTAGLSGPTDVITQSDPLWNLLLKRFQKVSRMYGFQRIETPVVENSNLYRQYFGTNGAFIQGLYSESDGQQYMVRTALLPSVLRSYVRRPVEEPPQLSKWAYAGNVIRLNNDHQLVSDYEFGLEVFGEVNHLVEAQAVAAIWYLLQSLGLDGLSFEINTTGTLECQTTYQTVLADFLRTKKYELCDSCNEHLRGRVLNIFRCSNLDCALALSDAPAILDFLDEPTQKHFTSVLEALDELQIPYQLNPLYAGLEGTSKTNVVIKYRSGDKSWTIGEAGYHDLLLQNLGAKVGSGFGFVGSLGTISEVMNQAGIGVEAHPRVEVFLVPLGELASRRSLRLFRDLTSAGVYVHDYFGNGGVKNQLKQAELNHSPIALIMGQKEAMDETVILRDVKSGMQEIFSYDKIVEEVKKRLGH